MARNQQKADAAANSYKQIRKRIERLEAKREELQEKSKTEKSIHIFSECMEISSKIEEEKRDLDTYAHLIVNYLYGEEEVQDAKIHDN